jgi:hypothetical protein
MQSYSITSSAPGLRHPVTPCGNLSTGRKHRVQVNLDDFRRHFESLSDEALLSTDRGELVAAAQSCYDEEVERRGLNAPPDDESSEPAAEVAAHGVDPANELVVIATYNIPEEASLARGLLQSAGIPYQIDNEFAALGGLQLRLWVPKALEADAIEILEMEISDEDLAAQAEAAGMLEMEESANEESGEEELQEETGHDSR